MITFNLQPEKIMLFMDCYIQYKQIKMKNFNILASFFGMFHKSDANLNLNRLQTILNHADARSSVFSSLLDQSSV